MASSQNTTVDYTCKATWLYGLAKYGDVMVGDTAFEFYNEKNAEDFVQIPWNEIDSIEAEVIGKKHIARFVIYTINDGKFAFSTRDNIKTLRAVRKYVPADKMYRGMGFFKVMTLGVQSVAKRLAGIFHHGHKE